MNKFDLNSFLKRPVKNVDPEQYLKLLTGVMYNHYSEEHVKVLKELKESENIIEAIDKEIKRYVLTTHRSETTLS
jgi:hypothetical protein